MRYILSNHQRPIAYRTPIQAHSPLYHFMEWAKGQEKEHHFAWTGICLLATSAVLFPLTMSFILMNGAAFPLMVIAMIALVMVVVLNLAAMPTQYTIPAFLLGALVDVGVIITTMLY